MTELAVVVPTLNAGSLWQDWIAALKKQSVRVDNVLVIDSGSIDDTVKLALQAGFDLKEIKPKDFNHGKTRQLAADILSDYQIIVFLTQDAILHDANSLLELVEAFSGNVAAVCGRQLPRVGAGLIEAHARFYNYPSLSKVRSMEDVKVFGLKTAFISNSFSAYRVSSLMDIGGFPDNVIFGEDMYVAAKLLQAGYQIAYAADACVYHSHNYSLFQEFRRYFDMGVFHAREPWLREELGSAEGEGVKFVRSEINYLLKDAFWMVPEGLLRTVLRYSGFRAGLMESSLPGWLKRKFSMNKSYFS